MDEGLPVFWGQAFVFCTLSIPRVRYLCLTPCVFVHICNVYVRTDILPRYVYSFEEEPWEKR